MTTNEGSMRFRPTIIVLAAGLLQAERMQGEVRSALDAIERARSADKPPEPSALSARQTSRPVSRSNATTVWPSPPTRQ